MTKNRREVLSLISNRLIEDQISSPLSAKDLQLLPNRLTKTQLTNICRTLKELESFGLIQSVKTLNPGSQSKLPYWEKRYSEPHHVLAERKAVQDRAIKEEQDNQLYRATLRRGDSAHREEIIQVIQIARERMQRSHPDKGGNELEFIQAKKDLDTLRITLKEKRR